MAERKRRLRVWHVLVGLPLSCGLSAFFLDRVSTNALDREIDAEINKLKTLGVPTTVAEMPKPGPDDQNAAIVYQRAIEEYEAIGAKRPIEVINGRPDPDYPQKLRAYLKSNQPVLRQIRIATKLPECTFKRNWSLGSWVPFPELARLKNFTKDCVALSSVEASNGNFQSSMDWLRAGRQISVHVREPTVIGHLVSVACESIVYREFQTQARLYADLPGFTKLAREFCDEPITLPSFWKALTGDIVVIRQDLLLFRSGKSKKRPELLSPSSDEDFSLENSTLDFLLSNHNLNKRVELKLLTYYRKGLEAMTKDPANFQKLESAGIAMDLDNKSDKSVVGKLAYIFTFDNTHAASTTTKVEATRRLSRLGLEIYASKATSGTWPKQIDTSKQWAIDPYTQKPFIYKVMSDGFGLYSVGANRIDDKGAPQYESPQGKVEGADDITFYRPKSKTPSENKE